MIKPQRNASSARTSKTRQPIYQEEDPSKFWEVDLSFRPIDLSVFGMWKNQGFRHNFSSYAEWEKTYGYQLESGTDTDSDSDSDSDSGDKKNDNKLQEELLRTTQLVYSYQDGKGMVPKLREPRNLYALAKELGPQQAARWPADIQVLEERVKHIRYIPQEPEPFYKHSGGERTPMVRGEENGGRLVYMYEPRSSFFVRSRVGGLRSGPQKCHVDLDADDDKTLIFDSRFESGNLAKAVQTSDTDYELWLRYDLYTNKHTQWFYFRVSNTRPNVTYRFTIVNFMKSDSLYNFGMKPLMYSEKNAQQKKVGWIRGGSDIKYYKNNLRYSTSRSEKSFYSLTWTVQFPHKNDTVYFAHCFPYTYTDLQDYLLDLSNDPIKNKICKQRVLCRTLAGNLVYVLTITSPSQNPEDIKHKKAVVITARVHPGECNSSWMMKGFLDYLCGNSADAKLLRDTFIFKIVPMLNPDGVIVGNYRCSLAGRDLNRNYKTVLKDSYPSVWHTKNMIRKLLQEREIIVYCDLHGHSRKQNVFIYGCENRYNPDRRLKERIFPLMLNKNAPDKFKFESCKFKVQKSKEGTGRIVMWNMGIMNSYTMEATFCGSTLGKKKGFHFSMADFEALGYHFCDTLLDYCDPDNTKSKNILIELEERLKKEIMIKLQRTSTTEVDLSDDYISSLESSDGGSDSSVSDGPPVHLQFTSSRPVKKKKKLKSKKERDRVRALKPEEPAAKPKVNDRPSSDHVCEKKSAPVTGHVQSHARQEKLTSAGMKYTLAVKRPKSHEEHTGQSGQSALADGKSDERSRRNDYLEALTHAYLRNGLLNQESAAPHFRYSGNKVQTSIPFNLEGLCPHHEQTFAAQYMAQQIQNMNSGETTLDDIVRSQITHQASISPIARQPLQRHILEVSAAQQRQQDMLQEGDKSGKFYRPRAQVPSATLYNYAESYEALQRASAPGDSGIQEQPEPEPAPVPEPEPEKLNQDVENKGSTPDDDSKKHAHKAKHKERGGRKSRMGMRDSDDDLPPANDGPDYVADPHKRTTPRVKSARGGTEMDSAIESIKELRQSLANNAMQQNLSPTTGGFIKRLMKETNEEIKELTNEIKHDIECEKKKERDKTKSHDNSEAQKVSTDNTHVEDLSGTKSKESSHNDYKRLEIENYGTGPRNKSSHSKDNSNIIVEDKKLISRLKSRSVTNFDRNYERTPKWKEPNLMVSGDTNNYSSLNVQGTGNEASEKKPGATTFELGHATSVSNSLGFFKHSYLPSTTSIATQTAKYVGNTSKVEMPPDHPIRLADTNGYGPSFGKSKSAKEFREGSVSVLTGSRDDRKPSEKLFEQTKRVKSAKSGRHSVGKMMVAPTILTETVPTKIQLMISQDHQEEKAFGGQFLPLSRTIRAPFYRNNSKKKQ